MRAVIRGGILSLLFWAILPTDAGAALGWIEKLSGPGPFIGWQINIPFACYVFEEGTAASQPESVQGSVAGIQGRFRIDYDCVSRARKQPALKFAIDIGRLSSEENELPYPDLDQRQKPGVNLLVLIPSVAYSFGEYRETMGSFLDVGAGVGAIRLSDELNFFETFWRPAFQPLRLTFRPLSLVKGDLRWEFLELALNATILGGELTAADFGAAGSFQESHEFLWNWGVRVDLYKLFRPAGAQRPAPKTAGAARSEAAAP
jgi:hypothetical protein